MHQILENALPEQLILFALHKDKVAGTYKFQTHEQGRSFFIPHSIKEVITNYNNNTFSTKEPHFALFSDSSAALRYMDTVQSFNTTKLNINCRPISDVLLATNSKNTHLKWTWLTHLQFIIHNVDIFWFFNWKINVTNTLRTFFCNASAMSIELAFQKSIFNLQQQLSLLFKSTCQVSSHYKKAFLICNNN